ncbi:hypothetical protein [Rhizobium rhizogenes]|uniref:hypothetical protein n=1 Tax=Rhizobium rhizogenes TaxID=359 RepID=UPI0022BE5F1F|nr:hypothetical protein [Rhizobium rhizogenes]MCZ7480922.1 hypothetical protein [Rhizobium rhizogenes]
MRTRSVHSEIIAIFSSLPDRSEELATVVSEKGATGLKVALEKIAIDMCNTLADRLTTLADDSTEYDPPLDQTRKETLQ